MTIKLSDIPQRDAFDILAAATKSCAVCHFRDQLAFTTPQLCALLRTRPYEVDEIVSTYPTEILAGEVFIAISDELQELLRGLGLGDCSVGSARLWTPRAVLRIAALMRNPVAKAIHLQVGAYVASIEAQEWMVECRHLESLNESTMHRYPPSLSSINELPPLQPPVGTPPHENRPLQPPVGTFMSQLEPQQQVPTG